MPHPRTAHLIGAATVAALLLAGCSDGAEEAVSTPAQQEDGSAEAATITARGVGRVTGTPDTLTMTIGVQSRAASASEALTRNAERARAVIDTLKGAGVAAEDLQTSQLSIFPTFDEEGDITGYEVTNLVTARVREIERAGEIVDDAVAVADDDVRVQGIQFSIEDTGPLVEQARSQAVAEARTQAEQLATAAGVELGAVRSIEETESPAPIPTRLRVDEAAEAVPIEPGSQELTVSVEVVFEIG
ncbi:MAG: SIMPL domain-containing protein [Acidimicrobiia bacterium]|nr:SIMPL domain-containing protein [Acidimicrobiia bacterium]